MATALVLPGCASLTTQVDVLRPSYVTAALETERVRAVALELATGNTRPRAQAVAELVDKAMQIRVQCYEAARDAIQKEVKAADTPAARQPILAQALLYVTKNATPPELAKSRAAMLSSYSVEFKKIDESVRIPSTSGFITDDRVPIPPEVTTTVLRHDRDYAEFVSTELSDQARCDVFAGRRTAALGSTPAQIQRAAVNNTIADAGDAATREAARLAAALVRAPTILGEGVALTGFRDAYYVAHAPDDAWKTEFNVAQGSAVFGSSDIVLKLNQAADFTVKGFTFDARSTADMVSKAGVAAVKLLAASYGMPLPIKAGTGATPAAPSPDSTLMDAQLDAATRTASAAAYRDVLRSTASMILANWQKLTAGNDKPTQAAVVTAFTTHKASWKPATPSK